eukprot:jgi/Phyca11/14332/fgenesh1_pg.PHYCAscaffold_7_\
MTTRTTVITAATKTARAKRSKKPKPLESEEKVEDNESSDDGEETTVAEDRLQTGEAPEQASGTATASLSAEVTEQPGELNNDESTNTELEVVTKMIERLERAVSRGDAETQGQVPGGIQELAKSLQRLTTTVMKRIPAVHEEAAEQQSNPGYDLEGAISSKSNGKGIRNRTKHINVYGNTGEMLSDGKTKTDDALEAEDENVNGDQMIDESDGEENHDLHLVEGHLKANPQTTATALETTVLTMNVSDRMTAMWGVLMIVPTASPVTMGAVTAVIGR